jgi:hypothetical protein
MTRDPHDVVKLFSGPLEIVEAHKATLDGEGIASNVVGTELSAGLGSVLPGSTELWVHSADHKRAEAIIHGAKKPHHEPAHFPHPTDSPKPGQAPAKHEPWINPKFGS